MELNKRVELEEITRNLWRNYRQKHKMEPDSWLHFFNLLFNNTTIERFAEPSDQTTDALIPLGKVDNLVFFLITKKNNYKLVLRECIGFIERVVFSKSRDIYILVLHPSIAGLTLLFFSPQREESIESLKTVRFPKGHIPNYFHELIESERKASPLELLLRLVDIPALEADFLNQMQSIQSSKSMSEEYLIGYLTILLVYSAFASFENWYEFLRDELQKSKDNTFHNFVSKIQEFIIQQGIKNDDLEKINSILYDLGFETLLIDPVLFQRLLQRYPYSLNEPSTFIQEVAITPFVLSLISESLSTYSTKKKKEGKYYTSFSNADFIACIAVYRMLQNRLSDVKPEDLFNWVYQDWGFETANILKSITPSSLVPTSLKILDPACGSGTFFISVARLLNNLATTELNFKDKLFPIVEFVGIDSDRIAVLVARLRFILFNLQTLLKASLLGIPERALHPIQLNCDKIVQADFFSYEFPHKFDLIMGNPPWVRHEDIGVGQQSEYKKWLQTRIEELTGKNALFDRKSDLYVYFCILGLSLLEDGGVLAFLTSNAWLEVKYGRTLQKFLLNPNKRINIFDIIHRSGTRLWDELGINSIFLIASKSTSNKTRIPNGTFTESQVDFSRIPFSSLRKGMILRKNHQDRYYRTELITKEQLDQTNKWAGTFLRTSKSERKLIRRFGTNGVPLSSLADIRFGIKTGANDFFHLKRMNKKPRTDGKVYIENRIGYKGSIERKYLVPLIKSPTHIKGFIIPSSYVSSLWLFYCFDSPTRLQGSGAWVYIKWGESIPVKIKQGMKLGTNVRGFSSIRSVKQRDCWYSLGKYPTPSLLWTKSYHDKPGCFYNQAQAMPDQRFYGIIVKQNKYLPLIFTYLNSSFVWAQMEAQGNTNMGFGVLDTNVYWLKSLKIPSEAITQKKQIRDLMERLIKENTRGSICQFSPIRADIDLFYAKYFDLSDNSIRRLNDFILRSINNRIR